MGRRKILGGASGASLNREGDPEKSSLAALCLQMLGSRDLSRELQY